MKKVTIALKRPYALLVFFVAFFGAGGAFMLNRASTNDRGLVINGIIHLEPPSADVFYVVMGLLSLAFTALGILSILNIARAEHFAIVIGSKSITFPNPKLWHPQREVRIAYDDMVAIRSYTQAGHPLLAFDTRAGTRTLNARWLPDGWNASRLAELITERWRARQP